MIRRAIAFGAPVLLAAVPLVRWGEDFRFARIALLCAAAALAWLTRPLARRPAAAAWLVAAGPALGAVSWAVNGFAPLGAGALAELTAWAAAAWVISLDERPFDYALPWITVVTAASVYGAGQALHLVAMPVDAYGQPDPASTFGLSNFAAEVLVVSIPLAVAVALRSRDRLSRTLLPAAVVAQIAYLMLAGSRAGWLGLAAGLVVAAVAWRPDDRRLRAGALVAAVVFAAAVALVVGNRLRNGVDADPSLAFRVEVWRAAAAMTADAPLAGTGPGTFAASINAYASERLQTLSARVRRSANHPHNEFLAAAAERGLPGLAALLVLLGLAAWPLWRRGAAWELGAVAGGATVAIFGFPLQQAPFWAAAAVAAALGLAAGAHVPTPPRGRLARAAAALGLVVLAGFFAVRAVAADDSRHAALLLENARRVGARDANEAGALKARAAEELEAALALWPYDLESLYNRAAATSTPADKIAALHRYLAASPADGLARVALGQALADDGQLAAAAETWQAVTLAKNAPAEAYHRLIGLYLETGNAGLALRAADEAVTRFPDNVQLTVDLADVYRIGGDHARAAPLYQKALETLPGEPGIYLRAGMSYAALGDAARAEATFRHGLELAPANPQFLLQLARLEAASGRRPEARRHLFSALQYDPELANHLPTVAPELKPLLNEQTEP